MTFKSAALVEIKAKSMTFEQASSPNQPVTRRDQQQQQQYIDQAKLDERNRQAMSQQLQQ